jgi:threonine aldolase
MMLEAMMAAEVGDDVFGDDPTVAALETKVAQMFGMEAALYAPSGTMTNQIAIRIHCKPGSDVICDQLSHIYQYEGGGISVNAGASVSLINGNKGRITAEQIEEVINNPLDIHKPLSQLVSIENTVNKGGGSIYDFEEIKKISEISRKNNLKLHLDGARLFNALIETKETPKDYGQYFDTISICLSKGLGCPIGSLLISKAETINQAKRYRKVMGGAMRQAGYIAAAGIYALDKNILRLKEDHQRAKIIGSILLKKDFVKNVYPIETNIIIIELIHEILADEFIAKMANQDIHCVKFGKHLVRFVTHLDFTDDHLTEFENKIKSINLDNIK